MKHKDYRIGNLVNYDNRIFEIHTLSEVYPTLNTAEFGIGVVDWNNLKPIPLTEDILLKCGFEKNPDKWYQINYFTDCEVTSEKMALLINLVSNRCGMLDTDYEETNCVMLAKRIYYLHQLQNLYFALTNEELTMSL